MKTQSIQRAAALIEVLGVATAGALLNGKIVEVLTRRHWISQQSPFDLLTVHAGNADLLLASRQLAIAFAIIYFSFFVIIVPLDRWRGKRGAGTYGLTTAGLPGKTLLMAGLATASLVEWPVLVHSLVDLVHPLGAMAPWRQAYFDMSWKRWQFWLFAGILSYAVVPVVEELLFRGYYQRRLAEAWGDGPAIIAVACMFTLSHKQYLIANLYNVTMILSLFYLAVGLGAVYAWTRSLFPSMIAHAIINVPMTPAWQCALLAAFVVGIFFSWRGGLRAVRQVFGGFNPAIVLALTLLLGAYALAGERIPAKAVVAVAALVVAFVLGTIFRPRAAAGAALPAAH